MAWFRAPGNPGGSLKVRTASGTIATFETNMVDVLQEVKCEINPTQDLHGYDHVWAAGAGKNKLPLDANIIKNYNGGYSAWTDNEYTTNGITFRISEDADNGVTKITASGTATADIVFRICYGTPYLVINNSITVIIQNASRGGLKYDGVWVDALPTPLTIANVTNIEEFWVRIANGTTLNNANITPMICLSTTVDYTYEPYSNVCPINGYAEANIKRCGVNLYSDIFSEYRKPVNYYIKNIPLKFGTQYTLKATLTGTPISGAYVGIASKGEQYSEFESMTPCIKTDGTTMTQTFAPTNGWTSPKLIIYCSNEAQFNSLFENYEIMLVEGLTADFTPYNGNTYAIAFGQTVYGGVLDVTRGKLKPCIEYPSYNGETLSGRWLSSEATYIEGTTPPTGSQVVSLDDYGSDIDLTPEVISAVMGENNVWHDANGDTEVKYLEVVRS